MMQNGVSVCLITYNHSRYIKNAVEGVLAQKVSFPMKLIIADDFSTDGTREILLSYQQRYPDLIQLIPSTRNVGAMQNWLELIRLPKYKYIAYFEGDDHWIDPLKLQTQYDLMERNDEISISTHNALLYVDGTACGLKYVNAQMKTLNTFKDVLACNSFPSSSFFYRNGLLTDDDYTLLAKAPVGDWTIELLLLRRGTMFYINKPFSIYNVHAGSSWGNMDRLLQYQNTVRIFSFFKSRLNLSRDEDEVVNKSIVNTYKAILSIKIDRKNYSIKDDLKVLIKHYRPNGLAKWWFILKCLIPNNVKKNVRLGS